MWIKSFLGDSADTMRLEGIFCAVHNETASFLKGGEHVNILGSPFCTRVIEPQIDVHHFYCTSLKKINAVNTCSTPGPLRPCWNLDLKVAVLLVTVDGGLILLLLYNLNTS